jgi:hypothetical protein
MTENPESQRAQEHVERIAVLCWVMLGMHLLATVGIAVNLLLYLGGDRALQGQSSAFREGQAMGQVVGIALGLTVHVGGALWAPINAYALAARRPWAYTSTLAYWVMVLFTCCCFPVGVFGLWSLTRPGVREIFDPHPGTDPAR